MNRVVLIVGMLLVACGGTAGPEGPAGTKGDTGPQGPQGVPGTSSGGRIEFDIPTNEARTTVATAGAASGPHAFDLAASVAIPSTATAIYVEVSGCRPAGYSNPGVLEFFTPSSTANLRQILIERACVTQTSFESSPPEAIEVWLPSPPGTTRQLTVQARETKLSLVAGISATVRVRGWYTP